MKAIVKLFNFKRYFIFIEFISNLTKTFHDILKNIWYKYN